MKGTYELNLTGAINHLIEGNASETEQRICGLALKTFIEKPRVKPDMSPTNGKPYCPNCSQPLNVKMKNGKNIYEYCKCCGQAIDWEV